MNARDFQVEFELDVPEFGNEAKIAADQRLRDLAAPHPEIEHARVVVSRTGREEGTDQFRARVTVHARPEDLTVTREAYRVVEALDEALAEVERLIRERYAEE